MRPVRLLAFALVVAVAIASAVAQEASPVRDLIGCYAVEVGECGWGQVLY